MDAEASGEPADQSFEAGEAVAAEQSDEAVPVALQEEAVAAEGAEGSEGSESSPRVRRRKSLSAPW